MLQLCYLPSHVLSLLELDDANAVRLFKIIDNSLETSRFLGGC